MDGVDLPFRDREQAGRLLADALARFRGRDVLVLALPRGGVPIAYEVAQALEAELDVLTVRKLGTPGQPELAAGAVASGGIRVLNEEVIRALDIAQSTIDGITESQLQELQRRERLYRGERARPRVADRTVILVDDGIATGNTMRAAVLALRQMQPEHLVVAVPVAAEDSLTMLRQEADDVVCLASPRPFWAVGQWYERFDQVGDDEVRQLLGMRGTGDGRDDA